MPIDNNKLLESVIQITEERDKISLEKGLIDSLSRFIPFDAIILLQVSRVSDNDSLEVAISLPSNAYQNKLITIPHEYGERLIARDEIINQIFKNQETVSVVSGDTTRTLYPITVNSTVMGILDIYGCQCDENLDKLISGFIRIYSNFLAMINDNEHDTLTGLLNRKTFDVHLSDLLSTTKTDSDPLPNTDIERRNTEEQNNTHNWFGILDIDHFKNINDNFGHVYGDEVLLLFADLMKKTFRTSDFLFRYGGEEFVVVLSPVTEFDALMIFERFRKKLEKLDFPQVGNITASIGTIAIDDQEHPTAVLENADRALYFAKENGRNQIRNYHDLIKTGMLKERNHESDIELF